MVLMSVLPSTIRFPIGDLGRVGGRSDGKDGAGHEGIGAGQSSEGSDPKDYSTVAELVFFYPCLEYQSLQSM